VTGLNLVEPMTNGLAYEEWFLNFPELAIKVLLIWQ